MKTKLHFLIMCLCITTLWAQEPSSCDPNFPRTEIQVQLEEVGSLSRARTGMAVVSSGDKIYFAGGHYHSYSNEDYSSRVDIYDVTTQSWATAELSLGRAYMSAIAHGNKVFFAGGDNDYGTGAVDNVDIYDISTNIWITDHLSTPGHSMAATAVGDKVFFAGGDNGFTGNYRGSWIDIYDLSSGTWTTSRLSGGEFVFHRDGLSAISWGNKAYFSGGQMYKFENGQGSLSISNYIDIYDSTSNTWSTDTMLYPRYFFGGISLNGKIYWAGGRNESSTNSVEIYDTYTGNSTFECLKEVSDRCAVVLKNNIIFYFSNTWGS